MNTPDTSARAGPPATTPWIRVLRYRRATPDLTDEGLLGWLTCELGFVRVDGVALRRTRCGDLALSFPRRTDAGGQAHAIVAPVDDEAGRRILAEVLRQLGLDREDAL